jgi:hypothetical protein
MNTAWFALYPPVFLKLLKQINRGAVIDFLDRKESKRPFEEQR